MMKTWFNKYRLLTVPFLIFSTWLIIRIAWVSDDAYITFRSIENFIHGYGPIYNIGERVQTFTHPLWFLLQSAANYIFNLWGGNPLGRGQIYYLNIIGSIALSFITLAILSFKVASSTRNAILGLMILSVSKAFLDFSTSGLENPLTYLILIVFIWILLESGEISSSRLFTLALLASLGALNRLDTFIFFLPALGILFLKSTDKWKTFITISLGFLPLVLWELFSLFYYGTPFPNTAFAKIGTGISTFSLMQQGVFYYMTYLKMDPITLLIVLFAIGLGFVFGKDLHKTIVSGILLYLIYILFIGGDFMGGRYFSAPLLASTAIISMMEFRSLKVYGFVLSLVLLIGIAPVYLIPERSPSYGVGSRDYRIAMDEHEITDERGIYMGTLGLLRSLEFGAPRAVYTRDDWIFRPKRKTRVELVGPLGVAGYRFGPNVHVIDLNALADPLMARLPLQDPNHWRIGHFRHIIPEGYLETLESGNNMIVDENIALYYDKLALVVRGELWNWARVIEMWNLNMGKYDYLLENVTASASQK